MSKNYIHGLFYIIQKKKLFFVVLLSFFSFSYSLITVHAFAANNIPVPTMTSMGGVRTMIPTKNMSPITRFIEVDNDPLFTPIDVSLDIVGVIIMLVAFFIILKSIHNYGKSTIGIAIIYFLTATLVLGAIRLIFILDDDRIYSYANVKDITEMTSWHTLFYFSIILFYLAGKTLTKLVSSGNGKSSYFNALSLLLFSVIISAVIIASMPVTSVQNFWVNNLQNTWFYTFGWFHIAALALAAIISIYLYRIRRKFQGISGMIGDIAIALGILASIHLWELLNETYRVIVVSDDFGEFIERVLWIPVFIFILISFIRLLKMTTEKVAPAVEISPLYPPVSSEPMLAAQPSEIPSLSQVPLSSQETSVPLALSKPPIIPTTTDTEKETDEKEVTIA